MLRGMYIGGIKSRSTESTAAPKADAPASTAPSLCAAEDQMRKSLAGAEPTAWLGEVEKDLESLKWHLWNGNVDQALRLIDGLKAILDGEQISPERQKLLRTIREFGNYIATNQAYIPDYGDRHRNGERISSAFAESAVNQLVSRRMVKQQQMHWTERGAHLLLQVRTQVMNGDLRNTFQRRYLLWKHAPKIQSSSSLDFHFVIAEK